VLEYTGDWEATLADCYGEYAAQINGAVEVITEPIDLSDLL
jgi:hypothetical protein